jgi:hypothetical protein
MCLGAFLPRRAPWCPFNQVRPRDRPVRASPVRDMRHLSAALPLLRFATDRFSRHKACYFAPHEIGRPKGWFLGQTTEGPSLSFQRCFLRFRRIGISARAASLQGFAPSAGWGHRRLISPRAAPPALLGFILPGVLPFCALASTAAVTPSQGPRHPRTRRIALASTLGLLSALQGTPGLRCAPCAPEFQRAAEGGVASSEAAGP